VNGGQIRSNGSLPLLRRPALLVAGLTLLVGACGSASASSKPTAAASSTVAGVGVLPASVGTDARLAAETTARRTTSTTAAPTTTVDPSTTAPPSAETTTQTTIDPAATAAPAVAAVKTIDPVGRRAEGNRVLMIGDSVMAGTSRRYSNDMCNTMVPLGWKVEVDAEVGRFVDFADQVLDKRLDAGWDAAVIFLGSNYGDNQQVFASMLEADVDRLSPRPVVLVTVTEFKPNRADVNAAIRLIAFNHPNVSVVDWAAVTATSPDLLSGDGLHPTPRGRQILAYDVAGAFGDAPAAPGQCLASAYDDDSAGSVDTGTTAPVRPPTTTRRSTNPSKTTTKPTTKPTSTASPTTAHGTTTPAQTTSPAKPSAPTTAEPPKTTAEPPRTTAEPPRTTAEPPKTSAPTTAP
jgi:hypothetical protein